MRGHQVRIRVLPGIAISFADDPSKNGAKGASGSKTPNSDTREDHAAIITSHIPPVRGPILDKPVST